MSEILENFSALAKKLLQSKMSGEHGNFELRITIQDLGLETLAFANLQPPIVPCDLQDNPIRGVATVSVLLENWKQGHNRLGKGLFCSLVQLGLRFSMRCLSSSHTSTGDFWNLESYNQTVRYARSGLHNVTIFCAYTKDHHLLLENDSSISSLTRQLTGTLVQTLCLRKRSCRGLIWVREWWCLYIPRFFSPWRFLLVRKTLSSSAVSNSG